MKCCCLMIGGWRIGDGSEADIALALSFVCGYFDSDCALPVDNCYVDECHGFACNH